MAPVRQYPSAKDMNLHARLKLVGTLHGRGFSAARIARELNYDVRAAQKDIVMVIDRYREFDDVDKHLRDVTTRMGEQLAKLNEQEAIIWKQLDWASEWVIQNDGFNKPIFEHNIDEGAPGGTSLAPIPLYGPRRPNMVSQLVTQLQSLNKQQSELLGLLNKNVDISVTLQRTELVQVRIIEAIKEADPETHKRLIRHLKAAEAAFDRPALPGNKVNRNLANFVEGEYEEPARG